MTDAERVAERAELARHMLATVATYFNTEPAQLLVPRSNRANVTRRRLAFYLMHTVIGCDAWEIRDMLGVEHYFMLETVRSDIQRVKNQSQWPSPAGAHLRTAISDLRGIWQREGRANVSGSVEVMHD